MPETTLRDNKTNYNFLRLLLFGFIIGIASITPGLSGGVLLISFGLYAPALSAVLKLRSNFKESFIFLLPLAIGVFLGVVIFGIIMKPLLENFKTNVIYFFIGMIIGSIPSFLKEANKDGFRIIYIAPLLITFSIGMIISSSFINNALFDINITTLIISGFVLSFGIIIPGISSSFILLQMGIYEKLISSLLSVDLFVIFWVLIGFFISTLLLLKLVNMAFNKFSGISHYSALGFLLSSVVSVFPGFESGFIQIINLLLLSIGAIAVFLFMQKK